MGRTVKPQSCNIIRLHVQFSYEVSEIKAIHHRLGAEWGKPGPAQPYLEGTVGLEIRSSLPELGAAGARNMHNAEDQTGAQDEARPACGFGRPVSLQA